MRPKFLFPTLLGILMLSVVTVSATDLRGRVDTFNVYTQMTVPLPGVGVGLFAPQPNGTFVIVRQAVTGPDGMYYLTGVYPGQYVLQIGGINYPLTVSYTVWQDIPVIVR
jgi:hypothetical protein